MTSTGPADPLLDTIREYLAGGEDFNRLAANKVSDETWESFEAKTYGPSLDRLKQWTQPATTMAGAIAALRLSIQEEGGVYGMDAQDRMVEAALGYLETLPT